MKTSIVANQLEDVYTDCSQDAYTDEELVELAQAGHTSANIMLCRRYIPLIMRYSHVSQLRSVQNDLEATLWESFLQAIQVYDLNGKVPLTMCNNGIANHSLPKAKRMQIRYYKFLHSIIQNKRHSSIFKY